MEKRYVYGNISRIWQESVRFGGRSNQAVLYKSPEAYHVSLFLLYISVPVGDPW